MGISGMEPAVCFLNSRPPYYHPPDAPGENPGQGRIYEKTVGD